MTRDELIHKTKAKIEELTPYGFEGDLIAIEEDSNLTENINREIKPIHSYINEALEESCNTILNTIPLHLIVPEEILPDEVTIIQNDELGTGRIQLPYNFLRIHSFKMVGWVHEVNYVTTPENREYLLQRNKYTMGKPTRPIITLDRSADSRFLEYYSVMPTDVHDIEKFCYVAKFDDKNIQANLAPFYALETAINVSNILGLQIGKSLSDELSALIQQYVY